MGTPAILLVLSCWCSHESSEDCVDPVQTPPSPVLTLFADVLFHRTLKTPYYVYLRFVVPVFLSLLLLSICIGFLDTELNYIIGIKHSFPCINICQVPREVLKTEVEDRGF